MPRVQVLILTLQEVNQQTLRLVLQIVLNVRLTLLKPSSIQNAAIGTNFEGFDLQQLGYGTSDAKKMTLSFYVKSNKTGI